LLRCMICGFEGSGRSLKLHIGKKHEISIKNYVEKYYEIKQKEGLNYREINTSDIEIILKIREEYPNFNSDVERFQFVYSKFNDYKEFDKFYNHSMYRICLALGVQGKKYTPNKERDRKTSERMKGKKLSNFHKEQIKIALNRDEVRNKISQAQKGRKKSETECKNISISAKGKPKSEAHKKALKEAKANEDPEMRARVNGINRKGKPQPPGWAKNNIIFNNHRGKSGIRNDIGHYVRSHWEANYARILILLNIKYTYELHYFKILKPNGIITSYTPDFFLPNRKLFVEVKGKWNDESWEKFQLFKKQYPNIKIIVIDGDVYKKLIKKYRKLINYNQIP